MRMQTLGARLRAFYNHLIGNTPCQRRDQVKRARQRLARVRADILYCSLLQQDHLTIAKGIDHTKRWWDYAEEMQAAKDYADDLDLLGRRLVAAENEFKAANARQVKLMQETRP